MRFIAILFFFSTAAFALTLDEAAKLAPVPDLAKQGGALFVDLNGDGHEDLLVSNPQGYAVYLFNAFERQNVQWARGWSNVLREGKAGDANSLPLIANADGKSTGAVFKDGALLSADGAKRITTAELLRVPGPAPKSPQESLKAMRVKPGYKVELVAHEPLVQDPVFVDWDERGRMWVVEMGDYPFAPGEKTNDGKTGQDKVSDLQFGRIKILEDTNGDAVYDKATLFLDGLKHPTGLAVWKGGVFVSSIPDVFYARDNDGDGKCDEREAWFTGFTAGNPQHLVNGFCWGLDGWLYGANGDSGGNVIVVKTGQKIKLGTNDFRFHPVTGAFEREAGRSQYGKWRDDFGNWFGNNNSVIGWHYYLPMRYVESHPERVVSAMRATTNEAKTVYPISPPLRRFNWASATNTLTSGCSPIPWSDGRDEMLLICEPANNLVHREVLDHSKLPITSRRHPEDADSEFIASADNWFRPSLARQGPDGALYVVDMYRLVLEHPEWIPADIAKGLDLRAGEKMGRIYRVSATSAEKESVRKGIESPNRWQRDTAQRLMLEKGDKSVVPELQKLADTADKPLNVRLQAAWTAHLLAGDKGESLITLMKGSFPQVRGASLVAAGSEDIRPEELATWFPAKTESKPVAQAPVITNASPDRQKIVQRYITEVARLRGDAKRGEVVFQKACLACHKLGSLGVEVGPDLATIAAKPAEQILEAIFDPNRAVEQRNASTQITRKDGALMVGLIATETPNGITLRMPGGVEIPIPRAEIQSIKTLTTSLMPEGLESLISAQEAADLLARIQGR
jgi:putative membrane-bound dehydrogenase-like protein